METFENLKVEEQPTDRSQNKRIMRSMYQTTIGSSAERIQKHHSGSNERTKSAL